MAFHLSTAQRSANAKKAAVTRKNKGEKPFGTKRNATKAAATRKARGEKPFGGKHGTWNHTKGSHLH